MRPSRKRELIANLTGLHFCDRHCGCSSGSNLWWWPVTPDQRRLLPDWLEGWTNGATTEDIFDWLGRIGKLSPAR
jgi:hypothetical protein